MQEDGHPWEVYFDDLWRVIVRDDNAFAGRRCHGPATRTFSPPPST
jgi:hypothetical protein